MADASVTASNDGPGVPDLVGGRAGRGHPRRLRLSADCSASATAAPGSSSAGDPRRSSVLPYLVRPGPPQATSAAAPDGARRGRTPAHAAAGAGAAEPVTPRRRAAGAGRRAGASRRAEAATPPRRARRSASGCARRRAPRARRPGRRSGDLASGGRRRPGRRRWRRRARAAADDLKRIKGVGPKLEELLHCARHLPLRPDRRAGARRRSRWVDSNLEGFNGRVTPRRLGRAGEGPGGGRRDRVSRERVDRGEVVLTRPAGGPKG